MPIHASPALHAHARAEAAHAVYGYPINFAVFPTLVSFALAANAEVAAVWIFAREVEEVDAGEDGQEAAEERDGVDDVGCVEASEQDEGREEGAGREGDVVEGVYAAKMLVTRTQLPL